jgi:hypothetical protein
MLTRFRNTVRAAAAPDAADKIPISVDKVLFFDLGLYREYSPNYILDKADLKRS